ncbi:MAG: hypothetical protein R3243_14475 [Arenibacter latericius]|nr:hypothetical protein [Arenibacter latericius]
MGAAAGFNSSGFLPVEGGETYTLNGGHPFAFYDEYKVFIVWGDTMSTQTAPANAGFIRITVPDANLDTAKLEVGAIETPYSEWKLQIPSDRISDLQDGVEAVDFVKSLVGKNLIDKTTLIDGYYVEYLSGNLAPAAGFSASQFIKINENTDYYLSSTNQIAFYDQAQEYISGILAAKDFTSVAGAEWIRVTVINTKIDTVQLEENTYGTFYEPFIKRIPAKRVGDLNYDIYETKNIVTVRANGTVGVDCDFSGRNAIQDAIDSILDASISNPYTVFVYDGFYYVLNSSEYKGNLPTGPSMIALKDYVSLEGESEKGVIIHAELPFNDGDIDTAISRDLHQTIYARSRGSKVSKCTLIGQDVRYTNHSDNTGNADSERVYENVSMIFRGTKGFRFAWGCGTFSGEKNRVIGGSTRTPKITFSTHNNTAFEKPSLWSFENHDFYSQADFGTGPNLENNGSLKEDEFFLKNCLMNNCYRMTYNELWISPLLENASFNHAEWRIKGSGNSKILFDPNISQGLSLRVISDSVGDSSSVTFNESSTAFDVLIKNPKFEKTPIVRHDRFLYWKSGYTYFRGSTGLSGYAFGNLDISDSGASSETSLGARLGDLSVTSKTLTINIDGVNYDIVFNEDYTSQPNSYVLAQINAVISGFGVCDEYCFGKEYYPEFTDVLNVLANNQASYIPKGKIVTEDGAGGIKIAEDGDKVLGVAIENIPTFKTTSNEQYNTGRFISNCYIYDSEQGEHFFVLCSKSSVVGEKYKVTNGELVLDTGGTITPFKDGIFEF